jgi:sugar-specific transcriptional regulator TrmB
MLVEKDFLKKLSSQLGLNIYEAKLWTALLSRGISTAGELSDIANVPRSRSYDVLESLEKKGFIIQKLGKPIKYVAIPPTEVLERVKKQIKLDADKQVQTMETLKESDLLGELETLHTKGIELVEPSDMAGSFRGRSSVYDQIEMMLKGAEESVIMMTTATAFASKIESFRKQLEKAKTRGVTVKIITQKTAETERLAHELAPVADVRFTDNVKARFVIVDNEEITFMLMDDEAVHPSYEVGIWVNTPFFTTALVTLFETTFATLKPITAKH